MIVGNSKAGLAAYKAPGGKSVVIYNGFNFNRIKNIFDKAAIRKSLNISSDYIIGMIATFYKQKDYKTYFKAAQLLLRNRKDVTFLAIGNGTDSIEAVNFIDPQYSGYFRLLGIKNEIESFIDLMDICVLCTYTEGISNAILEYMALGKPVVATKGGGTAEIVVNNKTGFLVSPSNPEDLAIKVEQLLNDSRLRYTMGQAGREKIKEEFSIDRMVRNYYDLYSGILMN